MTSRVKWLTLLGVFSLAILIFDQARQNPEEAIISKAEKILSQLEKGSLSLENAKTRKNIVSIVRGLADLGDEKRISQLAPVFSHQAFTPSDHQSLAASALSNMDLWNGTFPPFKREIETSAPGFSNLKKIKIKFTFKPTGPTPKRLYVVGNWTDDGQLTDLQGWKAIEINNVGNGNWSKEMLLEKPYANHFFNVVVRTAPWPEGTALGWTSFSLDQLDSQTISIPVATTKAPRPSLMPKSISKRVKVTLVGFDGASWYTLMPLIQRGYLPHFSELLKNGCVARLTSIGGDTAYSSVPCIHTALTGSLPFRHQTKKEFLGLVLRNRTPRLWRMLSDTRHTLAVVGLWGTFPIERIQGEMVSEAFFFLRCFQNPEIKKIMLHPKVIQFAQSFGVSASDISKLKKFADHASRYVKVAYPDPLESQLTSAVPVPPIQGGVEFDEQARLAFDSQVLNINRFLIEKGIHDALITYNLGLDSVCHSFWHDFQPDILKTSRLKPLHRELERMKAKSNGKFLAAFEEADAFLGHLMNNSETVVVFSDHGFSAISPERIWPIFTLSPEKIIAVYQSRVKNIQGVTLDYITTESGINYFLSGTRDLANDPLKDLQSLLGKMLVEGTDITLFQSSFEKGKDSQVTLQVKINPDLSKTPLYEKNIEIDGTKADLFTVFDLSLLEADHSGNGVLMMYGQNIQPGKISEEVYLQDVAPTVLALFGLPPDQDMDGSAFEAGFDPQFRKNITPQRIYYRRGERGFMSLIRSIRWGKLTGDLIAGILPGTKK